MLRAKKKSRRGAYRPACQTLETRELLSGMPPLDFINALPNAPTASFSTIPPNGDVNPYGVAVVPDGFPRGGPLQAGEILVSNFNSSANNFQGTGTTIVAIQPNTGQQSVFFQSQLPGLATGLGVLKRGFVIVGNVPTTDGTFGTIGQGALQILNRHGRVVTTLADPSLLDGPWDLAVNDHGSTAQVFVSNVLNGTITRIDLKIPGRGDGVVIQSVTRIGSGYTTHSDPAAVVVGPTGLAFDPRNGVLYVASTADNAIYGIPNASRTRGDHGTGFVAYADNSHLHGPVGLTLAPNGDLLTTNGDAPTVNPDPNQPSEVVEFTPRGQFVGQLSLDPAQGAAFGLTTIVGKQGPTLVTVEDVTNTVDLRTIAFRSDGGLVQKAPQFYEHYVGPHLAELNVVAAGVRQTPNGTLILTGRMQGPIDASPTSAAGNAFYVFGFNRGAGTGDIAPFFNRPGIRFDAVVAVSVTPTGVTATVNDFVNKTRTALPAGSVRIQDRIIQVALDPSLLPPVPGGVPFNRYQFNLWPRSSLNNAGMGQYVASFDPAFGMAPIFSPPGRRG